jgi:site-specific DNA-methyltransferase (adenine-specific)
MAEGTIAQVLAGDAQWCIVHGQCEDLLPQLPDGAVDVCITDPPYSAHTHAKQWIGAALTDAGAPRVKTAHVGLGFDSLSPDLRALCCSELARVVRRWSLAFTDIEGIHGWLTDAGDRYVRTCIWDKVDSAPQFTGDRPAASAEAIVCMHPTGKKSWNGGGRRNVFRHAVNAERGGKPHPSTKPLPLMLELVELFSNVGELILDPFCGSGSTGAAALRSGRRFIGVEMQEQWHAIARESCIAESESSSLRIRMTGQIAMFGSGGRA